MKHGLEVWSELKDKFIGKHLMLFLDYDGTLTPIAETPEQALMPPVMKTLLEKFVKIPQCRLAIISGRSLMDVKKMVGIKNIVYVGNHGLEIEGPGISFRSLIPPRVKTAFEYIKSEINKELLFFKGSFLEDKDLSFSVHYRLVAEDKVALLKNALKKVTNPFGRDHEVRVGYGKEVLEIKPPIDWDKGKAVSWLLTQQKFVSDKEKIFSICIGDDVTDEDAFAVVKGNGLAIAVGNPKPSHAQYYLRDPDDVRQFLQQTYEFLLN